MGNVELSKYSVWPLSREPNESTVQFKMLSIKSFLESFMSYVELQNLLKSGL